MVIFFPVKTTVIYGCSYNDSLVSVLTSQIIFDWVYFVLLAYKFQPYKKGMDNQKCTKKHGWSKPPERYVKLNIVAAFSLQEEIGATGVLIRDDRGHFVLRRVTVE